MPVPRYQDLFLPLLHFASDGKEHTKREALQYFAGLFHISKKEINEVVPSGMQTKFLNRVAWAKTFLGKALLIESTGWGRFRITQRGLDLLATRPEKLDNRVLCQYAEFRAFRKVKTAIPTRPYKKRQVPQET